MLPHSSNSDENMKAQEYDYPLKHTVVQKDNELLIATYGKKLVDKLAKANVTLDAFVGASPKTCENLKGLGYTLQSLVINKQRLDLGLTELSCHVWLPQRYQGRTIQVCFNCGSIMDKGVFIDAQEKEESKEEK